MKKPMSDEGVFALCLFAILLAGAIFIIGIKVGGSFTLEYTLKRQSEGETWIEFNSQGCPSWVEKKK